MNERKWKLIGHILRLPVDFPARKIMRYYSKERPNKKFVGRRRTRIVATINEGIRRIKEKHTDFPIMLLISLVSLQNIHTEAKNKKFW